MHKNIGIYYIEFITIKRIGDYESIHSVNPLYLIIGKVDWFYEEKNGTKYLVFDSTDENKKVLKNTETFEMELKMSLRQQMMVKKGEYGKDLMKITFDADDNLPLNKPLKLHILTIVVRSVYEKDGKFYRQIYLDECLCELEKCCSAKKLKFQKKLTLIKQMHQKNVCFVITGILKMLDLNLYHMFVINTMMYLWLPMN